MRIGLVATHKEVIQDTHNLVGEIAPFLDRVFVLVDSPQKTILEPDNAEYIEISNEGYDVGKFTNFFKIYGSDRDEVLFTNSTVSPLSSFEKLMEFVQRPEIDFSGATSAYSEWEGAKSMNGYHIQSFFIYTKGIATQDVINHFKENGIVNKWDGVRIYEVGISKLMIDKGYRVGAFIEADYMMEKYGRKRCSLIEHIRSAGQKDVPEEGGEFNGIFQYPEYYLMEGLPFTKNSVLQYHYRPKIIQYLSNIIYKG